MTRKPLATDNPGFFVPPMVEMEGEANHLAPLRRIPKFWRVEPLNTNYGDGVYIRRRDPVPNGQLCVPYWLTRVSDDATLTKILIEKWTNLAYKARIPDGSVRRVARRELQVVGDLEGRKLLGTCLVPALRREESLDFDMHAELDNPNADQYSGYGFLIILELTKELLWFHPVTAIERELVDDNTMKWNDHWICTYRPSVFTLGAVKDINNSFVQWQVNEFAQHVALNML